MDSDKFWNMLSEDSKYKVEEMLSDYSGSDGVIGRIFELFEEGAISSDCTVEEYLAELSPNKYVDYCYDSFLERKDYYESKI